MKSGGVGRSPFGRAAHRIAYAAMLLLLVVNVSVRFVFEPGFDWAERTMLADVVYGRAHKPFVYRVLVPITVRGIVSLIPPAVRGEIEALEWRGGGSEDAFTEYLVTSSLVCVLLAAFALAVKYLCSAVFQAPPLFADLVSLGALVGLPPFFTYYSYTYDPATLLLFALALACMARRKWNAYMVVFLLACLNKETAILLTWAFAACYFGRWSAIERRRFNLLAGLQVGVFAAVRAVILWLYRDNPGSSLEFHLLDHNVGELLRPYTFPTLLAGLGLVMLILYRWSEKPLFLRRSVSLALPLLVSTLLFGFVDELRDYYEAYPALLLLVAHSVGVVLGLGIKPNPATQVE
jgi:hypothetical protein